MLEVGVQNTGWFSWDDLDGSFARFKADGFETVDLGFPGVAFDPEKPGYSPYGSPIVNSYCHAWSCTPVYLIKKYLR